MVATSAVSYKMRPPRKLPATYKYCCVFAVVVVVVAGMLNLCWLHLQNYIIKKNLQLKPLGMVYELWRDQPIPMYLNIYLFNWTNSEQIGRKGTKPRFQQLGPYRFTEIREKRDIVWNDNNTISFRQGSYWFFDAENSNGSLTDSLTTLNVVAFTSAYVSRDWNYFLVLPLSQILKSHEIAITHTVGEFLFDGFRDPLIDMGRIGGMVTEELQVPFDKFGWFYQRNGTVDHTGAYNMNTGAGDITRLGVMEQWNYANTTQYFPDTCGEVRGSAGDLFPPGSPKYGTIEIFSPDICRPLKLDYQREVDVDGVAAYQYTGGAWNLDNGTVDPHNSCYCGEDCVPSGVVNVSTCRFGAPAFVSYPHFYQADPYFLDKVDGLAPEADKHEMYISVEPTTGIPLDVAVRIQLNILMRPYKNIATFENLPTVFFPMLWFEQSASLTPELTSILRRVLLVYPVVFILTLVLVTLGLLVLLVLLLAYWHQTMQRKPPIVRPENGDLDLPMNLETTSLIEKFRNFVHKN